MIGRIYKITSINTDKIYIGSTTKSLSARLRIHEIDYKRFEITKINSTRSFEILEKENYEIQLLEEIEYESKTELLDREGYYIKKYRDSCVNKYIAGRTNKQYRTDNADKIKQYRTDNADKIKQYYEDNIEKIKDRHRQYRIDNADKLRENRIDNADKLREKRKEKLECLCGKTYTRQHKIRHEKSKIHIAFNNQL